MNKTLLGLFLVANLHAISYEELLELAIQNNASLQINKSAQERSRIEGEIATRLENPNFEFEVANFSSRRILRENELGTRVGVSQSLLLPSVKKDKQYLAQSRVEVATQNYALDRAEFIYRFNLYYLAYKKAIAKEQLQEESLLIAQTIGNIAQERFEAGSIPKSELLQAKIEEQKVRSKGKVLSLSRLNALNALFLFANLEAKSELETDYAFYRKSSTSLHPLLALTQKKEAQAQAQLRVVSHNIQSIELFSEIEAEPDQDIFRVGVSIDLPIFNKNSQEKQLAKIEIRNQEVALNATKKALALEVTQLQNKIREQEALVVNYEALMAEQNRLLEMYKLGYRLAKMNLLKLSTVQKELLQTKEKLLETKFSIEENIIKLNYLQGADDV